MRSPIDMLPAWMKTDVTVLRGGGVDENRKRLPVESIEVKDCVVSPNYSADTPNSNASASGVTIYHRDFVFLTTDRVIVPVGARMSGDWQVDGRAMEFPLGVSAALVATKGGRS